MQTDRMQRALHTALPPEVAARLQQGRGGEKPAERSSDKSAEARPEPEAKPVMRVVDEDEPQPEPTDEAPAKREKPKAKPAPKSVVRHTGSAKRTRGVTADLGELDLGERIRQITTRMPISLADRLDIAVLRQKRTNGDMRSIQAIMIAGAERVLEELESDAA